MADPIGTEEDDFLFAFEEGGELLGLGGNDTLVAGEGEDFIDAGDGDDVILGASNGDVLFGGAGADTFGIGAAAEGRIVIKDFELGVDTLDLSEITGEINLLDVAFEGAEGGGEVLIFDGFEIEIPDYTAPLKLGEGAPPLQTLKLIDFEAAGTGTTGPSLLGGYEGLNWWGFGRVSDEEIIVNLPTPGGGTTTVNASFAYRHNVHPTSGDWVAVYEGPTTEGPFGQAVPHSISREDPFTVKSLHVGSATRDGLEAIFKAYRGEQLVGQKIVVTDTSGTEHVSFSEFNFGNIDRFELTMTDTGTQAADVSTNQAWLYIDDLVWV